MRVLLRAQPLRWRIYMVAVSLLALGVILPAIGLWLFVDQWPLDQWPRTPLEVYEMCIMGPLTAFGPGLVIMVAISLLGYAMYRIRKRRYPEPEPTPSPAESSAPD